jgi:cell division protein FtsI/penicillin-binding protein 2
MRHYASHKKTLQKNAARSSGALIDRRFRLLSVGFCLLGIVVVGRLFSLQVLSHTFYEDLAANAHDVLERLVPVRGDIVIKDPDGTSYPVATNKDTFQVFAEPRNVKEKEKTADLLAPMLVIDRDELLHKLQGDGLYAPLARGASEDLVDQIRELLKMEKLAGIYMNREPTRTYPELAMGGHILGFVGADKDGTVRGRYGVEGYWNKELAGTAGELSAEKDVAGRWIPVADRTLNPAQDGADIVLTIDRTIQFYACEKMKQAVLEHQADGGSVVILDPKTGDVLAMCGFPDFDPNSYQKTDDISVFNNPVIFRQYEPGSVMKVITMAAGIDRGVVGPNTTYEDTGEFKVGPYTIRNSDGKAHGIQTMTQVLDESLNTGAIFVQRAVGSDVFREYVEKFGFGSPTGIKLATEASGDISLLKKKSDIYFATASYGQGMSATPLQLAAAYGAIANGGMLMQPRIVSNVRWSETHEETYDPKQVRQVISARTATLLGGMLVSVVENGHGKRAGVPGYWIAGKTGTAQVPRDDGPGYKPDVNIGTFAGFGPVEDPKFVMVVRVDHPRDVAYAESSAAPTFGEIAKFLLQYYHVQPTRLAGGQ